MQKNGGLYRFFCRGRVGSGGAKSCIYFKEDGSSKQCSGCLNPSCDGGHRPIEEGVKIRCRTEGGDGVFFTPELNRKFYSGERKITGPPPPPLINDAWCHWINVDERVLLMDVSKDKSRARKTELSKSKKQIVFGEFISSYQGFLVY